MTFPREQKKLGSPAMYNPPPGYYEYSHSLGDKNLKSFTKQERFYEKIQNSNPGPGSYYNNTKEQVKRRLIEESLRKEAASTENSNNSNIKISSIPSIPKKSATRVYEELAPGILILHQEEYENTNIGPGSYNVSDKCMHKKPIAHRIPPEHPKKIVQPEEIANVPTIAEQIRNEKRKMYKQNLIKNSTVNKNQIQPADLCLEVIILREKLLRGQENPPPGYYYNQQIHSSFKKSQFERPPDLQVLAGKEERFKANFQGSLVGPGTYQPIQQISTMGGFIARDIRRINEEVFTATAPGPGQYIAQSVNDVKIQAKGNYPPIFGSGCTRFSSAPKVIGVLPGPGSYQIDKKRNKKQKYIKIRRELLEYNKPTGMNKEQNVFEISNELSHAFMHSESKPFERKSLKKSKNNHYFASNVERFQSNRTVDDVGPGHYDPDNLPFTKDTYNKGAGGYRGSKQSRFNNNQIRPKIGPGTYYPIIQTIKQKKIINVVL